MGDLTTILQSALSNNNFMSTALQLAKHTSRANLQTIQILSPDGKDERAQHRHHPVWSRVYPFMFPATAGLVGSVTVLTAKAAYVVIVIAVCLFTMAVYLSCFLLLIFSMYMHVQW